MPFATSIAPASASRAIAPIAPTAPAPKPLQRTPNPQLRLDPVLGLLVVEIRDASGAVVASIPTARQLAAYRAAAGARPHVARLVSKA